MKRSVRLGGLFTRRGQAVLEYALLLVLVGSAFMAMSLYVRRAIDGKLRRIDERVVATNNRTHPLPVFPAPTGCFGC